MTPYTHTGFRYVVGRDLVSAANDIVGVVHAINGPSRPYEGAVYRGLCGREVRADTDLDGKFNVRAGGEPTCKRCLRLTAEAERATP